MFIQKLVLITGTTSGLGRALLEHYANLDYEVICVNRRSDQVLERKFPQVRFHTVDITIESEVRALFLAMNQRWPSLIILNAGINKADNLRDRFDFANFTDVLRVNLLGVYSFVAVARELGAQGVTFVGVSSTFNIVANPGHIAYYLSKWGIHRGFAYLQRNDPLNTYKSFVLGPVRNTNLVRDYPGPKGFQRHVFNFLAASPEQAALSVANFATARSNVRLFPLRAAIFFIFLRGILVFAPFLYPGTQFARKQGSE